GFLLLGGRRQHRRMAQLKPRMARGMVMALALRLDADLAVVANADAWPLMDMGKGNAAFGEIHPVAAHQPLKALIQRDGRFQLEFTAGSWRRGQGAGWLAGVGQIP